MAEYFDPFERDRFVEYIEEITANERCELIVIRSEDGGIAGGLTVQLSEENGRRVGWIYDIAVAAAEQDQNHGEILLGYGTDWLSLRGAGLVVFDPRPNLGERHRPGESRPFDSNDSRLIVLNLSKAVEYGTPKYPHAVD